ncbi:MAG: hypothetical protein ACW986_15860 [Promethearchaeota archaeon]|jgi:hypothetical protein
MIETYSDFMIFGVKDTGEQHRLDITEEEFRQSNGSDVLFPSQVALIVKEQLRRIYIWKGMSSSVRKKFIASRVASRLQRSLMDMSNFHRCKIVSVDQGDEPTEFMDAFGFEIISNNIASSFPEVTQYINEEQTVLQKIQPKREEYGSIQEIEIKKPSFSYKKLKENQKSRKVLKEILELEIPCNFVRKHVLIGNTTLYGLTIKKAEIFNESHEREEWDVISKLPREIYELEGQKLRIHFNRDLGKIEALEVLEKIQEPTKPDNNKELVDYNSWTVKQLKQMCRESNIKIPSSYRKADIIRLVMEKRVPLEG